VSTPVRIRIASYNAHKCRGLDRRVRPERIAGVLRELDADLIALQEVIARPGAGAEANQPKFIAETLGGYSCHFGGNREIGGAPYGNAVLSRLPVRRARNYDLTRQGRERRGCLRVDVELGGRALHLFNVHLGTSFFERRHQARRLLSDAVLRAADLEGPSVVVGDFNEWTRGLASRLMAEHYDSVDLRLLTGRRRSYPGVMPLLHLDHFYFDRRLKLQSFALHRTRRSLIASDHLPIVAEFVVGAEIEDSPRASL
jgi:endonuclease/exonuclease/phosphatase family metal-dependent hydrolase